MTPHATRSAALSAGVSPEPNLLDTVAPRDSYYVSTLDDLSLVGQGRTRLRSSSVES